MTLSLAHDHERIRALSARLATHLDAGSPPAVPDFASCRWELTRELTLHLACERYLLAGVPGLDLTLGEALREHMREWTGIAIAQRWSAYRAAARALLRRIIRSMDHEERSFFPKPV